MTRKKASPEVFRGIEAGLRMFRWVVLVLAVLFLFSGIQKIEPGNVGLLLRFGRLVGTTSADQVREPGLLPAMPYPIDRVIRVPVKQEGEVVIKEVWKGLDETTTAKTIDPLVEGYCLTGDNNVVQPQVAVKYKISNPIAFQLWTANPERILHDAVLSAMTQTLAGWHVNDALRLQRSAAKGLGTNESLAKTVWAKAQKRLDAIQCGLTISALEFKEMHPPRHVVAEFQRVQSERIEMETAKRDAEGFAAREVPKAQAESNRLVQEALAYENTVKAKASAECSVFEQLYGEYRKNPALLRQRIYMETLEQVLASVGKLRFVAPEARVLISDGEVQP
ncbi:MAG: protease modulator HflK [Thermoguttaceae bacterium]